MGGRRQQDLRAGLSRDEHARGEVPRREVELPVGVHLAGREPAEVERRAAAAADVPDPADQRRQHRALVVALLRRVGEARGDEGRRQTVRHPRRDAVVVAHGARSGHGPVQPPRAGVEDDAHPDLASDLDRDGDGVGRIAVHVVGRPVQGVDDPAHPARAVPRRPLLTEDGVVRAFVAQAVDDEALRRRVDLTDEVRGRDLVSTRSASRRPSAWMRPACSARSLARASSSRRSGGAAANGSCSVIGELLSGGRRRLVAGSAWILPHRRPPTVAERRPEPQGRRPAPWDDAGADVEHSP